MNELRAAYKFALADVGKGGDRSRNNVGEWLSAIRTHVGLPMLGNGAWCAVVISYWVMLASRTLGERIKSRSARQLALNAIKHGGYQVTPDMMKPGDVVIALYRRGTNLHHVRLVRRNRFRFEYIGGNETSLDIVRRRRWLKESDVSKGLLMMVVP